MTAPHIFSLDGDWTLYYAPHKAVIQTLPASPVTKELLDRLHYDQIPSRVPGNFELDMERAGIIEDPFYACNIIHLQKYENLHLFYTRTFVLHSLPEDPILHLSGVDTFAEIFVNGTLIGKSDNMLIPHAFPVSGLCIGENEITVHILPTHITARKTPLPIAAAAQSFNYDALAVRKAPHMFGWDIMPRALSGGIWKSVWLEDRLPDRIDEVFAWTEELRPDHSHGRFAFFWNLTVSEDDLQDYSLHICGKCGESIFQSRIPVRHTAGKHTVSLQNPKLWYPRGYGAPNLYEITVTLLLGDTPVHEYRLNAGMRTVELHRTSLTDAEGNGEFCFTVNGQKIFWMGTNWVPIDAYHSRDRERLPEILPLLTDIGCNAVRCWGGNVYEDDLFYDYCDRHGIMIWQDFAHACSVNPQDDDYCQRFAEEAISVIKRLRNHPSLLLWAGDNEVDFFYGRSGNPLRNPNLNRLTREVLPRALAMHDFTRPYLPSSPYIDEEAFSAGRTASLTEDHIWGPRDYFKGAFYRNAPCHFASEIGYHGCPSPRTLARFIRPEELWHWKKHSDSRIPRDDWTCHASCAALDGKDPFFYRIGLMSDQVKTLFPAFAEREEEEGLSRFSMASQISQAEAKKFFIEKFRAAKWRRTGIIWWNLIDGWPQISDAVVDYYGTKKLAYHYIKHAQSPLCLLFDEPKNGKITLLAASDLQTDMAFSFRVRDLESDQILLSGEGIAKPNSTAELATLPYDPTDTHCYLMEWTTENGIQNGINHYVTRMSELDLDRYLLWMKKAGFDRYWEGFDR